MNKIKENKKLFILIVIISLLAVLLGSYAIYKSSNKDETANKIEKSEKLEKKAEKKLKEAKKSGDKEEIAKAEKELKEAEEKTEDVKKSVNSSTSNASKPSQVASKPSTNTSSSATSTKPTPKPKEKTKVWIVDKPAWVENRVTPIFSQGKTVYVAVDGETGKETEWDSYDEAMSDKGMPSGYGNVYDYIKGEELIGYDTETINHPEEGHWEYR